MSPLRLLALALGRRRSVLGGAVRDGSLSDPATLAMRGQVDNLEQQVRASVRVSSTKCSPACATRSSNEKLSKRPQSVLGRATRACQSCRIDGAFGRRVAHELNQPFGAIVNYTEACTLAWPNHLMIKATANCASSWKRAAGPCCVPARWCGGFAILSGLVRVRQCLSN